MTVAKHGNRAVTSQAGSAEFWKRSELGLICRRGEQRAHYANEFRFFLRAKLSSRVQTHFARAKNLLRACRSSRMSTTRTGCSSRVTSPCRELPAVGTAVQRAYQPFKDASRASREEFGDLLAEGLYARMGSSDELPHPPAAYWRDFAERPGRPARADRARPAAPWRRTRLCLPWPRSRPPSSSWTGYLPTTAPTS